MTHEWDCFCDECLARDVVVGSEAEATDGRTGSLVAVRLGVLAEHFLALVARQRALTEALAELLEDYECFWEADEELSERTRNVLRAQ